MIELYQWPTNKQAKNISQKKCVDRVLIVNIIAELKQLQLNYTWCCQNHLSLSIIGTNNSSAC